ncbi:MAG: glycosyltransferase [Melioribacteraceae bacterium]|nr:glycosyltransferase [Melioribacteraceae bacterium]MCF8266371.1 glycosyltransferase [Melioribacteraceae bacterium]
MYKVLILAYYFPPMGLSGVQRTLKFAKYMADYNWMPTVIAPGNLPYFAFDLNMLEEAEAAKINIIRTSDFDIDSILNGKFTLKLKHEKFRKVVSDLSKSLILPDNKIFWAKKAFRFAQEELTKNSYDAIFVSLPPFSLFNIALKLKKQFDIPLIVDYRDSWLNNQFALYPTPMHRSFIKNMEDRCLRGSDKIITTNRRVKEDMLNTYKFLTYDDITLIPHGFDQADFDNAVQEKRVTNKMIVTYSGSFYEFQTPKYFLRAFKKLLETKPKIANNIDLRIVGLLRNEHIRMIDRLGLTNHVKVLGYIPHNEAIRQLISSDILWMMIGKRKNTDMLVTGKMYEYFGSRKPIIASVPKGAAEFVLKEYGASYITDTEDENAIMDALIKCHKLFVNNNLPRANEDFVKGFDRKYLTEKLVNEFQKYLKEVA